MPRTDLVSCLLPQHCYKLSQTEKLFLEIKLFTLMCHELTEVFMSRYKEYQQLIKAESNLEGNMRSIQFIQEMIRDILVTEEYSLEGIAVHTGIPEEVLSDVAAGVNTDPTFYLSKKLFELHIGVRRDLYDGIMRKMASEYLA